jgi:hypothetical protein
VGPKGADAVTTSRSSDRQSVIPVSRGRRHFRHARLRRDDQGLTNLPPAGQPGHGRDTNLRRQPPRIVEGRADGRFTTAFELVCRDCGDHPDLDYSEISPRLQRIRGPYPALAALVALEKHLGLGT